jgi:signal transduction histidine kinase
MLSATESETATGGETTLAAALCPVVQELQTQGVRVAVQGMCETFGTLGAANAALLRQAFREILDNARDAIADRPAGEIRIAVARVGGVLRVRFRDTGGGMPRAGGADIFAPFFTTKPGHLGLGLALCQAALRALGGTVAVASTGERGTELVVEVPCLCGAPRHCARRPVPDA